MFVEKSIPTGNGIEPEFGDSFAMLDGLLSSIAVVLGLIAILLQGRELRAATQAQKNQVTSLTLQIKEQESSNKLSAYAARLQYPISEMQRLDSQVEELRAKANLLPSGDAKSEKWEIIKNSRGLHGDYKKQAKDIDQKFKSFSASTVAKNHIYIAALLAIPIQP